MRVVQVIRAVALASVAAVLVGACGGGTTSSGSTGQRGTLKVGMQYDLGTLDPQVMTSVTDQQMVSNLFEGLVKYKLGGVTPEPALATSWTSSADGLNWDFKLRPGVKFQKDLGVVSAADVVFSFQRLKDPQTASPNSAQLKAIKTVEAVGDGEVKFTLSNPDPAFLDKLCSTYASIMSRKSVAASKDPGHDPVGTGPYQFDKWVPQQQTVLKANDSYWGGKPKLAEVDFVPVPDPTTMYNAFEAANLDIIQVTDPDKLAKYQKDSGLAISSVSGLITRFFGFNTESKPFDNAQVREAIADAINRPSMIKNLFGATSTPADSILAPGVQDVKRGTVKYTYDVAKAKSLLSQAGYPSGFSATFTVPNIDRFTKPAQVIQQDLKAVGIDLKIEVLDTQTFLSKLSSKQGLQMFMLSRSQDATPDRVLSSWFGSSGIPANNWARIRDPKVDSLLAEATSTLDASKRTKDFGEVQDIVAKGNFYYYIDHENQIFASHKRVHGFVGDPKRSIRLDQVSVG